MGRESERRRSGGLPCIARVRRSQCFSWLVDLGGQEEFIEYLAMFVSMLKDRNTECLYANLNRASSGAKLCHVILPAMVAAAASTSESCLELLAMCKYSVRYSRDRQDGGYNQGSTTLAYNMQAAYE